MNGANEEWSEISGFPGYFVSSAGRVASEKHRGKERRIMNQWPDKDGHMRIRLCRNNKPHNFYVHRLVATAFIANPATLPIVNHRDENPSNNRAENLEWCTSRENTIYNDMPVRRAETMRRPIIQKSLDGETVRTWESRGAIESATGYSGGNITAVCQGKRKSAHGYLWEYKEEWR